jgi:integrase
MPPWVNRKRLIQDEDFWRNKMGKIVSGGAQDRAEASGLYTVAGARKYLNSAERRRVIAAIDELAEDEALFVLTLAWTGARVSEVLTLTPGAFQLDPGIVTIRTLKRRRHAMRELPLPPELIAALARRYGLAALGRGGEGAGDASSFRLWPWSRTTAWRIVKRVMALAGISGRPACPRGLRHGFGVGALQAGVPLSLLQRWLGHSRISSTAIYAGAVGPEEHAFACRFWQTAPKLGRPQRGMAV